MTALTLEPAGEPVVHPEEHLWEHHGEEHHGEHAHDVPGMNRLGLLLFMASETMLFLAMMAARFYLAGTFKPEGLNMGLGLGLTAILLVSSFAGYRGVGAIGRGNRRGFILWIAIAAVLGIIFTSIVVGVEWPAAAHEFPLNSEDPQIRSYSTAFYAMTGLHVFHLLQGLLGLILLVWLGVRGHFSADSHWGATGVVRFWTFVDIMWLVIVFPVLYIL
jgi:heme/copper-type cytochrome/quinol oxidase subunit 3